MFIQLAPFNVALPILVILLAWLCVSIHAAFLARRINGAYTVRWYNRWYVYTGVYLLLGVLIVPRVTNLLRARLLVAFRVPNEAMAPTLQVGDYLYVTKWTHARGRPARDEVVAFESVDEPGLQFMKRVLGMPGDTLQMRSGALIRNGQLLQEPYAIHTDPDRESDPILEKGMREWQVRYLSVSDTGYAPDFQNWGPVVVPSDSFFSLGDNRDASYDSRYYGFVPFVNVIGRASTIYFSLDPDPADAFLSRVRWNRIGRAF